MDRVQGHAPEIRHQPLEAAGEEAGERLREPGAEQCEAEQPWPGQDEGEDIAQRAIGEGPLIRLFDMGAGVVDEMHVVDA